MNGRRERLSCHLKESSVWHNICRSYKLCNILIIEELIPFLLNKNTNSYQLVPKLQYWTDESCVPTNSEVCQSQQEWRIPLLTFLENRGSLHVSEENSRSNIYKEQVKKRGEQRLKLLRGCSLSLGPYVGLAQSKCNLVEFFEGKSWVISICVTNVGHMRREQKWKMREEESFKRHHLKNQMEAKMKGKWFGKDDWGWGKLTVIEVKISTCATNPLNPLDLDSVIVGVDHKQ